MPVVESTLGSAGPTAELPPLPAAGCVAPPAPAPAAFEPAALAPAAGAPPVDAPIAPLPAFVVGAGEPAALDRPPLPPVIVPLAPAGPACDEPATPPLPAAGVVPAVTGGISVVVAGAECDGSSLHPTRASPASNAARTTLDRDRCQLTTNEFNSLQPAISADARRAASERSCPHHYEIARCDVASTAT